MAKAPANVKPEGLYMNPKRIFVSDELRVSRVEKPVETTVTKMCNDISTNGQLQPIGICDFEVPEGYDATLVFGEHRLLSCDLLDIEVECKWIPVKDKTDFMLKQVLENSDRTDPTPIDRCNAIHKMCDNGFTQTQVAEIWGVTKGLVSNIAKLDQLCKLAQKKMRDGTINQAQGLALLELSEKKQITAVEEGWSVSRIKDYVRNAKDKADLKATTKKTTKKTNKPAGGQRSLQNLKTAIEHALAKPDSGYGETKIPLASLLTRTMEYIRNDKEGLDATTLFDDLVKKYSGVKKKPVPAAA